MKREILAVVVIAFAATVYAQMGEEKGPRPGMTPGGEMRGPQPGMNERQPMGPGNQEGEGQQDAMMMRVLSNPKIAGKVGLSQEQVATLKKAFYDQKMKEIDLRASMEKAAMEQARLMMEETVDEDAVMKIVEKTGQIHTEMAKQKVQSMLLLKKTLKPEQVDKLREFMAEHRGEKGRMGDRMQMKERMMREGGENGRFRDRMMEKRPRPELPPPEDMPQPPPEPME